METLDCEVEIDPPLVDQTNTLTEYVPDGTLRITYAVEDDPAARLLTVDVETCTVWPAALCTTANTTPVIAPA